MLQGHSPDRRGNEKPIDDCFFLSAFLCRIYRRDRGLSVWVDAFETQNLKSSIVMLVVFYETHTLSVHVMTIHFEGCDEDDKISFYYFTIFNL